MENNNIFIDLEVEIILHNYFFQIFWCCSNYNATPLKKNQCMMNNLYQMK
jgi:hypothetical protein